VSRKSARPATLRRGDCATGVPLSAPVRKG